MYRNGLKMRLLPALLASLVVGLAMPALASGRSYDHVYANSFGNLIVESAAGYKRIVVGQGRHARELSQYSGAGRPKVAQFDGGNGMATGADCYQPPFLVKGRSYMYGFDQGEIPMQGGPCR